MEKDIEANLNKPILTNNQDVNMNHVKNLKFALKTNPQLISCPYCKFQDFTSIEKKCNTLNTIFCIFTLGIFWGPHQYFRNKDCNCYDVKHTCQKCGQELNQYKAC